MASRFLVANHQSTPKLRKASQEDILAEAARLLEGELRERVVLSSPAQTKRYLQLQLATLDHECFAMLCLNAQHEFIEFKTLFHGTVDYASVYPREVIREALAANAVAVIFAHNHPSGRAQASPTDHRLTRHLIEACRCIEIRVLDHLIVTRRDVFSFAERGYL